MRSCADECPPERNKLGGANAALFDFERAKHTVVIIREGGSSSNHQHKSVYWTRALMAAEN
jgi:hypothetical protein